MSKEYNIIGDVAGQYETLLALLDKMPKDATPVSVGDMCDRGPKSKEVLEFFKQNGLAVLGNHDHMMVDYCKNNGGTVYRDGVWFWNGGAHTVESFFPGVGGLNPTYGQLARERLYQENKELLDWVEKLPLYLELDGAFISHAIKRPDWSLELTCSITTQHLDDSIIWNRGGPRRMKDKYQICGHNSQWGLKRFTDKDGQEFAICIDTSRTEVLTGIHWPSGVIYQQEYIKSPVEHKDEE
jgi:hypothetical protein